MTTTLTLTVEVVIDETNEKAPSLNEVMSTVEEALKTRENGIQTVKVTGRVNIFSNTFPTTVELFEELKPLLAKYGDPKKISQCNDISLCSVAVILNGFMAALIAHNRLDDPTILNNLGEMTGLFISNSHPRRRKK